MTIADERPKPPSRARGGLQFVHLSNPADAAEFKTLVRSHAARNPRRRKRNVVEHQEKLAKEAAQKKAAVPTSTLSRQRRTTRIPRTGATTADPSLVVTGLSTIRIDPFNSFTRPLSRLEYHLLDHCEFSSSLPLSKLSLLPSISPNQSPFQDLQSTQSSTLH